MRVYWSTALSGGRAPGCWPKSPEVRVYPISRLQAELNSFLSKLQEELFDDSNINRILLQTKIRQLNQQIPVNRQMKADIVRVSPTLVRGSGCGSVGRAVASYTRDPQIKSRHGQNFTYQLCNNHGRGAPRGISPRPISGWVGIGIGMASPTF